MDRLTPEQLVFRFDIWRKLHSHWLPDQADRQLVELRDQLQSLSQEAVRDEVLEEAATMCLDVGEQEMIRTGRSQVARTYQIGCENCHDAIVALKREPNAGAQASGSSERTMASANPAPAAPDVAEKWVFWEKSDGYAVGPRNVGALAVVFTWDEAVALCKAANALLARLGQGLACPRPQIMGVHACKDRTQCWEPCGDLGHHEEYARPEPGASDD